MLEISNTIQINSKFVKKSYDFVINLLKDNLSANFKFHSIDHMKEVLKYVEIIGGYYGFKEDDMNLLRVSAIFHDIGYLNAYIGHEEESVNIAKKFLVQNNISESQIQIIANAILATKVPQTPADIYSKILCDADLINLTYDNYFESAELLRQEWLKTGFAKMSEKEFHENSVRFFNMHNYHTEYGKKVLNSKKKKILYRIHKRLAEMKN
jgi:putative nucleotidyltransferase with HDIG domain